LAFLHLQAFTSAFIIAITVQNEAAAFSAHPVFARRSELCIQIGDQNARISRASLRWLITLPTGSDRALITQQLGTPYCFLARGEQVAYPGAWDPTVWIVLTYRGDRYLGYNISYGNTDP
jgi:hypothetical protein